MENTIPTSKKWESFSKKISGGYKGIEEVLHQCVWKDIIKRNIDNPHYKKTAEYCKDCDGYDLNCSTNYKR